MKQRLLQWWYGLAQREQRLILIALPLVLLGIFYWGLWQPLHQAQQKNVVALQQIQQQLLAFQQARPLLAQGSVSPSRQGGSLAQIVSGSARRFNVTVSRMQPQNEQLQLVLEDIAFDKLLPWLHQLRYENGVRLINLDISVTDKPGIVRVRRMVIE